MTTSRIGRGALVTLGAAASMAWAAGAANACEPAPKPHTPTTHDHHGTDTGYKTTSPKQHSDTACKVDDNDVQWAPVGADGKALSAFHSADKFQAIPTGQEPVYGIEVKLAGATADCTGSIPVSLASYGTHGKTWDESGGVQTFVDYATTTLSTTPHDASSHVLKVKLPGAPGQPCFGQIDLYFGTTIYDGKAGAGHGPLPDHDAGVSAPKSSELISAWNGADAGGCAVVPPTSPPPSHTTTPPSTPPTTSPTTHPAPPVTSKTTAPPTPTSSTGTTPSTPPTTTSTPGTPTLAHTGANVGELSLVALAFFGAGGTTLFASRKAKLAGARKH